MMKKNTEKAKVQVWLGHNRSKWWWVLWVLILFTFSAGIGYGQVGGAFNLIWSTIDGGGGTASTGGTYSLGGSIGQPDAGRRSGGLFGLDGGFWGGGGDPPAATPVATATATSTTPTASATTIATATSSSTASATATSTSTATATPTPTPTLTRTNTPTPLPIVVINEVDSDNPGSYDRTEFIELYDGGRGNTALDGRVVVFYDGASDTSYVAIDLDGSMTDSAGYFTLGNPYMSGIDIEFPSNLLQNGADAVAIYYGDAAQFPEGARLTTTNLIDAIVYDTSDPDDPGLLALLNPGQPQVNENANGNGTGVSIGRCRNGSGGTRNTNTYLPLTPSPDGPNDCPAP